MDGRIFDLRDDLLKDLKHDWTVDEMAERAGLSVSHFPTVFKTHTHFSPGAYLKKIRLDSAKHLLETTHDHVDQIATKVGMPDESHFARDFKIAYNVTPTEYRRQFNDDLQANRENGEES
ncbi:MAG: helix-turn-helix transcriptional regulator [Acidobacteria bacterium]|nr:helix-turn-helix transcriptional regulator [Acidobacteriota bacterium]MBK9528798.1 helix-turn-helix transcriptional regulator [Acidobacteriota bacterium]MBP7474166.1 helix-turn-helix transcriptional regulator [Pyrinomonadaceae bacterium]MBP9109066.1 helix-turn-helix transcriptional regulator [Pyrinomonadaceae bacterium]